MAMKPTSATPRMMQMRPTQWCLYCYFFKKMIDNKAVITVMIPLIIW